MPRRRKKKILRVIHESEGPLSRRLSSRFVGCRLVFSDASQKRQGGLAAVLFDPQQSEPLVATRSVPLVGSNELELQAALFALALACRHFLGQTFVLFSDNQDAIVRLDRAKVHGLAQDPALARMLTALEISTVFEFASVCWVQGHAGCRGNTLADFHARAAAG